MDGPTDQYAKNDSYGLQHRKPNHSSFCQALTESGAAAASSPAEVAAAADTVVTMLPASPHVRGVYCGADGILSTVQPGTMLIDSSTIDPSTSLEMSQLAAKKNAVYMVRDDLITS